jgi:hypothetical protein
MGSAVVCARICGPAIFIKLFAMISFYLLLTIVFQVSEIILHRSACVPPPFL